MRDIVKTTKHRGGCTGYGEGCTKDWMEKDGLIGTEWVIDKKAGWIEQGTGDL